MYSSSQSAKDNKTVFRLMFDNGENGGTGEEEANNLEDDEHIDGKRPWPKYS